jgi:hypothetical protein
MGALNRRAALGLAAGVAVSAFAPAGLRLSTSVKRDLWRREQGAQLRGGVFVQRRVYPELDGPYFLGEGRFGPPVTDFALDQLADAGANLASWSGPGLFAEGGAFQLDAAVEDHIGGWLDRCRARGLFTTLCFRSGPGRSAFAFHPDEDWYPSARYDDSLWRSEDKQAAWVEMVTQTLARFGDHPALAGVVPMDEPNGSDLGLPDVWPQMARRLAGRVRRESLDHNTPLLWSPDRWARLEAAAPLRDAIGPDEVLALHHYEPWAYTHQAEGEGVSFNPATMHARDVEQAAGDWAALEFGAVRHAPDPHRYLRDRIDTWERLGANWAVFRWTSGWDVYERREGSMNMFEDPRLLALLRQAFAANRVRPS